MSNSNNTSSNEVAKCLWNEYLQVQCTRVVHTNCILGSTNNPCIQVTPVLHTVIYTRIYKYLIQ